MVYLYELKFDREVIEESKLYGIYSVKVIRIPRRFKQIPKELNIYLNESVPDNQRAIKMLLQFRRDDYL
ncbi:MAG: hypothetical protein OEM85_03600 [Gammaproteobacteria bacterium]|nr:hypothetical protein [Gammaproteobacteria bacterium]MDH3372439.1 hypothetical protein [Gammaproteobacteria bacterium]MDH3410475.1 hypothetical protein [Gammaproteobacteria bacterium]